MILKIPTKLSDKQIEEYQRIYKEQFKEDISKADAEKIGIDLLGLIAIVYGNDGK
jgi:hypothetical protein